MKYKLCTSCRRKYSSQDLYLASAFLVDNPKILCLTCAVENQRFIRLGETFVSLFYGGIFGGVGWAIVRNDGPVILTGLFFSLALVAIFLLWYKRHHSIIWLGVFK